MSTTSSSRIPVRPIFEGEFTALKLDVDLHKNSDIIQITLKRANK